MGLHFFFLKKKIPATALVLFCLLFFFFFFFFLGRQRQHEDPSAERRGIQRVGRRPILKVGDRDVWQIRPGGEPRSLRHWSN